MSTITVRLAGMSGSQEVVIDVPEGNVPTVADAREAAGISEALGIRSNGERLADDAPLSDDQVLVTTAPDAKQGR